MKQGINGGNQESSIQQEIFFWENLASMSRSMGAFWTDANTQ